MAVLSTLAPKDLLVLASCALTLCVLAYRAWSQRRLLRARAGTPPNVLPAAKVNEKDREPGEWTPVAFDYPRLEPHKEHFSNVKPIPYRPFKWGDYHVTMGIRGMAWDEWIELDREFPLMHKVADYRIRTRGDRLLSVHPAQPGVVDSGHAAAEELMYELSEYLSRRHPDVYKVTRRAVSKNREENGWYGEGKIKTITIIPFNETYDLEKEEPLKVSRMLMQEDFTIMLEGSDGRYYLQAGAVVIAGSWRLEDKMGMPLEEIHTSGNVPQYQSKLQMSMERYFRRLPLDKPIVRNNYAVQLVQEPEMRSPAPAPGSLLDVDPDELAWAATMNGSEDTNDFERAKHINDQVDNATTSVTDAQNDKGYPASRTTTPATPRTVRLRTERQTLRRLPRTGAIVFTIRVYQTPFEELLREPGVPGRMASAIRSWPEDVARYKARDAYEGILPLLDQCHAEQVAKGLVSEEDKKSTFPF
ncbi:hypothetical protein PYCCODRAFT_472517 [Trametes coccinea BRFM310]|uniref:HRQ family protein n=1 Tax=Trametes coccinea (strain BRFM310) TaxID=1353009 RepID=A0A1Y2INF9_TRAC3|nr:hypothetical protein PYCCODRAFT_472517 [Trametes coccinea BRFM310]